MASVSDSRMSRQRYLGPNKEILGAYNILAMEVMKKLGVTKFEPVVAEFSTLIPGLRANRLDIIAVKSSSPRSVANRWLSLSHSRGQARPSSSSRELKNSSQLRS